MHDKDPYNMSSKSIDELLRMKAGHNPDTLEYQYAQIELEKRKPTSEQYITPNEPTDISENKHNPWKKPLGIIAIGIITILVAACAIWVINHYFNLNLK